MRQKPATKIQEQFYVLNNIAKNNSAYNIPVVFRMSAVPNVDKLEKAINYLVRKYDVLSSEYSLKDGHLLMNLKDIDTFTFKITIEQYHKTTLDGILPDEIIEEVHRPFDLSTAPLFRVKIFEYPKTSYISFVFHHIIIDLRSKNIFFKDLEYLYNSDLVPGFDQSHIKQYGTYSEEHNTWLKGNDAKEQVQLWSNELPPINHLLNLPISRPRLKSVNFDGRRKYFTLDNIGNSVDKFSSNLNINDFVFCLSAYFIMLNKISQQDKIVVGVPLSNRRDPENLNVFGCFVNILPIVVDFVDNSSVEDIIKQVRKKLLFAHRKQEVPYLTLLEQEKENRNLAYNPYFQSGFTFEPLSEMKLKDIITTPLPVEKKGTQLDLFFTMWRSKSGFSGYVEYSTNLFSDSMAKRIESIYSNIIHEIINGQKYVNDISILPEEDKTKLEAWNDTDEKIDTNKCLHKQFEEQVILNPHSVALKYNGDSLSYSQLNTHANRLSHYLISKGVTIDNIVGISLDRSFELIISIIAIHKAGAAYLPLDFRYPKDRIKAIIEDGKPKLILTKKDNSPTFSEYSNVVFIDDIISKPFTANEKNPEIPVRSNNLAYVLFTSGSTGRPKGVMIEHHSVINKLVWMQQMHPMGENESFILKTPITFDVSVWELFWWYFSGSSLTLLPPDGEKSPHTIIQTVANNDVSTIIFVPSMFAPFIEYIKSRNNLSDLEGLKYIILIGEIVSSQLVMNFNELRTTKFSPRLVNTYGPTEATVAVSYYNCPEENPVDKVFIGKPIFNTKLLIINKNNQISPIGIQGELVISGENLARGYKNSEALTAHKFINIKGLDGKDLKVYKTGDLAKWDESGEIDFLGRADNQVKIRGYRIELGDIESKLLGNENIESAAVIVYSSNDDNKQLVAYVTFKEGVSLPIPEIKKYLLQSLPEYMVPAQIIILDKMPLNSSEKIDRKSLPAPRIENQISDASPISQTEMSIQKIWGNLLGVKTIGVTNNFFDIGGNSLLVISMVAKINQEMGYNIEPVTIMQYPNIRELAGYLSNINSTNIADNKYNEIQEKAALRRSRNQFR